MKPAPLSALVASIAFSSALFSASGAVIWDESVNGNLSNNRMAPTSLTFKPGINTVAGSLTGGFGDGKYYDYFKVAVPAGFALTGFTVNSVTSLNSGAMLMGIAGGNTFPSDQNGNNVSAILGFAVVGPSSAGAEIFPTLATPNYQGYGNIGFTNYLGAGTYSVWIQDWDTPATYQVSLRLEAAIAPVIKVKAKILGLHKATIRGSAGGTGTTVSFRIGKKGAFKPTKGKPTDWTAVATRLRKGKNEITIRAVGYFGTSTQKVTIVLTK
jgi:hypothetical protein